MKDSQSLALARIQPSQALEMNAKQLKLLLLQYYQKAVELNMISAFQLIAEICGVIEQGVFVYRDEPNRIRLTYRQQPGSIEIERAGKIVCQNDKPGEEWLVPGDWIGILQDKFARIEAEQNSAATNRELSEKHAILSIIADQGRPS